MAHFHRRDAERVADATVAVERMVANPDTQRGRWGGDTGPRLATTCKDPTTDTYPAEVDNPNTYWVKWAKGTYAKEQGEQTASFSNHPDEAVALAHNRCDGYLDEGTDVWVAYNNERWWVIGPGCLEN